MHTKPVDNASAETADPGFLCGMRRTESATRHVVAEADIWHALRHHMRAYKEQGAAEVVMLIGPARDGSMLEIGLANDSEDPGVIHAMPVRRKYWP